MRRLVAGKLIMALTTNSKDKKNISVITESQKNAAKKLDKINKDMKNNLGYEIISKLETEVKKRAGTVGHAIHEKDLALLELGRAKQYRLDGKTHIPNAIEEKESYALLQVKDNDWFPAIRRLLIQAYYWLPKNTTHSVSVEQFVQEKQTAVNATENALNTAKIELDAFEKSLDDTKTHFKYKELEQEKAIVLGIVETTENSVNSEKKELLASSTKFLTNLSTTANDEKTVIKRETLSAMTNFLENPNEETKEKFEQAAANFRTFCANANKSRWQRFTGKIASKVEPIAGYSTSRSEDILKNIEQCQKLYGSEIDTNKKVTPPSNEATAPKMDPASKTTYHYTR